MITKPELFDGPVTDAGDMLDRQEAVAGVLGKNASDYLYITGISAPKGDVLPVIGAEAPNLFPTGSMGCAAMTGLGLALAQPDKRVVVVTGDGEILMNVSSLATIGVLNPPNLSIVVVDNEAYGETGWQQSHTGRGVDIAGIGTASGIPNTRTVSKKEELAEASKLLESTNGTTLIILKVAKTNPKSLRRPQDQVWNKNGFRQHLLGHI